MRRQNPPKITNFSARPAGASDDDSDSDGSYNDFGTASSLSKPRNKGSTHYETATRDSAGGSCENHGAPDNGVKDDAMDWDSWEAPSKVAPAHNSRKEVENWGRSPTEAMRLACKRGNLEKLKQLFSNHSSPPVNEFFGGSDETLFITSCVHGRLELVEYLLKEHSADPNLRHEVSKLTPLMCVAGCDEEIEEETLLKCLEALFKSNAKLDMQNRFGLTALMIAIQRGRSLLVKYLVENGADVNIQDPDGSTALSFAAARGDGRVCRLLLEHNADIQLVDKSGFSPVDLAQDKGFSRLADLLYIARDTKWKPGLEPGLMTQLDVECIQRRKDATDNSLVREESSIDMLLASVDGSKYFENFRRHKVSYVQFLKLDDDQLREIGVEEVGIRGKILDHIKQIHNVQWQPSSLKMLALNQSITAAETVCMVANIKEHLKHISGTLQYVSKRIKNKPLDLKYDIERNKIVDILQFCQDSKNNCSGVINDLTELSSVIRDLHGYNELQVKGKIPKRGFADVAPNKDKTVDVQKLSLTIGTGCVVLGFLYWKWDILERFSKLWNSIS